MAMTSREIRAAPLARMGIYNLVVDVPFSFPKRQKSGDPGADKVRYGEALDEHNDDTGLLLLPKALEIATCPLAAIPRKDENERAVLATKEEIEKEVARRKEPDNYSQLWGRPLREVRNAISTQGRPLAPQSIEALATLLKGYEPSRFDEYAFVEREMKADARLYRDPRFRAGLTATLEQVVADYR
jgi:enoyl-CoA hydratase/carnithine racemase